MEPTHRTIPDSYHERTPRRHFASMLYPNFSVEICLHVYYPFRRFPALTPNVEGSHECQSLIRRMARHVGPMLVCGKIMGSPREIPVAVPASGRDWAERKQSRRGGEVSRGHIKRWCRGAERRRRSEQQRAGSSRRSTARRDPTKSPEVSPRERPERCPNRTVRGNEKGK